MNCVASFGASICPLTPGKEQVQTRLIRYIQTQMLGKILTSVFGNQFNFLLKNAVRE